MLALALAVTLAATPSSAPDATATPLPMTAAIAQRLDADLSKLAGRSETQAPALSVAIAERGAIVYRHSFGKATPDTRFRIASVTNLFTAVAIMQLVQQHILNLDATVATYLPNAPYASQITVRQLLQHTSGLWDYNTPALADGSATKPTPPAQILALIAAHPLASKPGATWAYSSSDYVVLGLIVEASTGQPLDLYERQSIFIPASMYDTTNGEPDEGAPMAVGYASGAGPVATSYDPSWFYGAGDAVSTPTDLARFDIALLNGTLVTAKTFALMLQSPVDTSLGFKQALGFTLVTAPGKDFAGLRGGMPGFRAENETIPADGLSIVVFGDASTFVTTRANQAILEALYPSMRVTP